MQHATTRPTTAPTRDRPRRRPDHRAAAGRLAVALLVVTLGLLGGPLAALVALGLPAATALAVRDTGG